MASRQIPRTELKEFFDQFNRIMPAELVEIEVAGLDLGDQIAAEWVALSSITYDPKDSIVLVDLDDGKLQHTIQSPADVVVEAEGEAIQSISIKCGQGHVHLLRLKEPRALPSPAA